MFPGDNRTREETVIDNFATNVYVTASGTIGGWQGEAISFVIGFAAGLLLLTIPRVNRATTWQKVAICVIGGMIAYWIVAFVMGHFFHEQLD